MSPWVRTTKFDPRCAALADRHYSRRKVGSPQFMPPGQTMVLVTEDGLACWGWWRPHPDSGLPLKSGRSGWTCTLFRNEGPHRSSDLILAAERALAAAHPEGCGSDGMLTYIYDRKVKGSNPGYCYKVVGWTVLGRSADGRKTLLSKPFDRAGEP